MESSDTPVARVRKVDWRKVLDLCETHESVHIGVMDQSVRTHVRNGRYKYIDPRKYEVWTERVPGSRTQAHIYMRKKPDAVS